MTCEGMLLMEALMRVVLPAMFKKFVFQPTNLERRLSRINWKSCFVGLLWKIGKPRYLPKLVQGFIPRIW